jgi:hypothetical protein
MNDMSHVWASNEMETHYVLKIKYNIWSNLQSKFQPQEFLSVRGTENFMGYVTDSKLSFQCNGQYEYKITRLTESWTPILLLFVGLL